MGEIKDMLFLHVKTWGDISPPSPQVLRPWWQVQSVPVDSDALCAAAPVLRQQYLSSTVYIFRFKMASTWRYTLVCLDGVMDISTTD